MTLPAMMVSQNGDLAMTRPSAVQWVERNLRKIRGRAAIFLRYSPYDMEDFIQLAYVTALTAVNVSTTRNVPFEACFWILFTAESRKMASNPATRNCYQEFTEDYTKEGYAPTAARKLSWKVPDGAVGETRELTDDLIEKALSVMTARQREVWVFLLDKKHCRIEEIAEALKVKRQVIEELRESGLRRVRRHFGGRP
jgi:fructose-specific phosphotransferase system component IIB